MNKKTCVGADLRVLTQAEVGEIQEYPNELTNTSTSQNNSWQG
jgi:hypothetical protein